MMPVMMSFRAFTVLRFSSARSSHVCASSPSSSLGFRESALQMNQMNATRSRIAAMAMAMYMTMRRSRLSKE